MINNVDIKKLFWFVCFVSLGFGIYVLKPKKYDSSQIKITQYKGKEAPFASDLLTQEEKSTLSELHHRCFDETRREKLIGFFRSSQPKPIPTEREELITKEVNKIIDKSKKESSDFLWKTQNLFVARDGNRILGLFTCSDDIHYTHAGVLIHNVCVDPDQQSRGLGSLMMEEAIKLCRKPDRDLALTVYRDHERTIALYERLGFSITTPSVTPEPGSFDFYDKYFMLWKPSRKP